MEEIIKSLQTVIENLSSQVQALSERVSEIEYSVNEVIINTVNCMYEEDLDNEAFGEFNGKYGGKFAELIDPLRVINGEEYDPIRTVFDDMKGIERGEDWNEEAYIDNIIAEVVAKLQKLKGIPEEPIVEEPAAEVSIGVVDVPENKDEEEDLEKIYEGSSGKKLWE